MKQIPKKIDVKLFNEGSYKYSIRKIWETHVTEHMTLYAGVHGTAQYVETDNGHRRLAYQD